MEGLGFGITISLNDLFSGAVNEAINQFKGLQGVTETVANSVEKSFEKLKLGAGIATAGAILATPFVLGIEKAAEFSDINADIMKTTGQSIQEVTDFSKELEKIDTRTSLKNLLEITKIGGSMGVATNQMLGFTTAIDMASVALGDEFKGGVETVTKELGTIKNLFANTKAMDYGLAMSSIGSAINELGAVGQASGGNIADFTKRIGQLGAVAPSLNATLGLGATLEELGITSERAAGGLANVLLVAGENASAFSKQLGLSLQDFREIYSNKPEEMIMRLGQSLKGLDEVGVTQKLKELKVGSQESLQVFLSLKDNTDLLRQRMELAGSAFDSNTSLSNEFAIKNNTLAATFDKVSNVLEMLSKSLGESLSGAVQPFAEGFLFVLKATNSFIQSPIGSVITKIAAGIAVATTAIGLGIVAMQAWNIVTAMAIPLMTSFATTLGITSVSFNLFTAQAVAGVFNLGNAVIASLNPLNWWRWSVNFAKTSVAGLRNALIASYSSIVGFASRIANMSFSGMVSSIRGAVIPALTSMRMAFLSTLTVGLPLVAAITAITIAGYALYQGVMLSVQAFNSLDDIISGKQELGSGFLGFMQKVGLTIKGVMEVFSSAGKEGFTISEGLANALGKAGLLDFVVAIGTYAVRIKEFFSGFGGGFGRLSEQFSGMFAAFSTLGAAIGGIFDSMGVSLGNNESQLSIWASVGRIAFEGLASIFTVISFVLTNIANILAFVIGVTTDFFQNFDTGMNKLGKRWDTFTTGIRDSVSNLPFGDTMLGVMGIETKENTANGTKTIQETRTQLKNEVFGDPQLKKSINQQKEKEQQKESYQSSMVNYVTSPQYQQSQQQPIFHITNITELDGQVVATKLNEINENQGARK